MKAENAIKVVNILCDQEIEKAATILADYPDQYWRVEEWLKDYRQELVSVFSDSVEEFLITQ